MPLKPFNPEEIGTPECDWRSMLRHSSEWCPAPGTLLVVAPHPDDEVLGAGGLARTWAMAKQRVTILSVTDGEAADPQREDLRHARRAELRCALRTLARFHITVERLGLPDGEVTHHRERLRGALRGLATGPTTIVAPFEKDGHPDHEAVGEVCLDVARRGHLPIVRYPVWAWHHATPRALKSVRWGLFHLESSARRAKQRALQCFESQLRPRVGPPIVPAHVLPYFERPFEAFVL